jgi:alpha-beta hydrolase superfamily lysophospholipase
VPGGEQAARLVEGRADEPAVHDPWPGLVVLAEREGGLVALDSLLLGSGKVDAVVILLPATPARGVVVRRDLYRRPPRSK